MTLWKESTNVLPADGATVWVRRFPGIEHPKQALFSAVPSTAPTFTIIVNAPDTSNPVQLIVPCSQIHSWRPVTGPSPGPGGCAAQEAAGSPIGTAIPAFVGQLYHDTSADSYYRSTGLTTADWMAVGASDPLTTTPPGLNQYLLPLAALSYIPGLTAIDWSGASITSCYIMQQYDLARASFPNLTSIGPGPQFTTGGVESLTQLDLPLLATATSLGINDTGLITLSLPTLVSLVTDFGVQENPFLTTISAPALTSVAGNLVLNLNPLLTSITLPLWVPWNGQQILLDNNALDIPTVEAILAQCVAAGVTTCTIQLSGGTNAGLSTLSTQGQTDYAVLIAAGNTVTINP